MEILFMFSCIMLALSMYMIWDERIIARKIAPLTTIKKKIVITIRFVGLILLIASLVLCAFCLKRLG